MGKILKKILKILGIILGGIVALCLIAVLVFVVFLKPQIDKHPEYAAHKYFPFFHAINSYEPYQPAVREVREDGSLYVSEIEYGTEFPNSFLDIYYPTEDTAANRPTIFFIHGGGFWGGNKVEGDPLAKGDGGSAFTDYLLAQGFNIVKMEYAFMPEYTMPTQLKQIDQALAYLTAHSDELGLNMNEVVLMGGSGGATFASQYGLILTNPTYAKEVGVTASISKEQIKVLVFDDPPIDLDDSSTSINISAYGLIGKEGKESKYFALYQSADYVTAEYLPSFLVSANHFELVDDAEEMYENLKQLGVDAEHYSPSAEEAGNLEHCFMEVSFGKTPYAQKAADQMLAFIGKYIER